MLKKIFVLIILALIISTTLIKNYTKKLDEEIFLVKENINYLNSIKDLFQLEYDYLSSPEKLLNIYNLYFDEELQFTSKNNLKILSNINEINLKDLK